MRGDRADGADGQEGTEDDPRRHARRACERRSLVLQELARHGRLSQERYVVAKGRPLGVVSKAPTGTSPYPAFMALVHRQLRRDYHETDLRSEGLRVFTTLDPRVQQAAERTLKKRAARLEKTRRIPKDRLEGAVVVAGVENGEVQALVGGRDARFEGFNRALDADEIAALATDAEGDGIADFWHRVKNP